MKTIPKKTNFIPVNAIEAVLRDGFNSLIDVVTEQQKEIKDIKEHIDSIEKSLIRLNKDVWKQPYSAQRSTGEKYCECIQPTKKDCTNCCYKCGRHPKTIKPQEDIKEQIIYQICYLLNMKKIGIHIDKIEECADKILEIVRGEV